MNTHGRTHARTIDARMGNLAQGGERRSRAGDNLYALCCLQSARARAHTHIHLQILCVHVVLADLIRITQYAGRPAGWPGSSAMGRRRRGCVRACMRYQRAIEEDPGSIGSTRQPRRTACCRPGRGERGSRRDQLLAATTSPLFWACICMCVVYALAS